MKIEPNDLVQYKIEDHSDSSLKYGVIEHISERKDTNNDMLSGTIALWKIKNKGCIKQMYLLSHFKVIENFGKITPAEFKKQYPERFI